MFYFRMPFDLFHTDVVALSSDWTPLVTALWVVLMTNAINLIDGLDGLAAGIVAIAGFALFLFADQLFDAGRLDGANIAPLIAIIAVGVCLGFLPMNWNPAKIRRSVRSETGSTSFAPRKAPIRSPDAIRSE